MGLQGKQRSLLCLCLGSVLLLVTSAAAVTEWRESNLEGGWQIWITATDFDTLEGMVLGKDEPKLASKAPQPWLSKDVVIAITNVGFAEYVFESPEEGEAHLYARVLDFRPGGAQSWFLVLNSENAEGAGIILDTPDTWQWQGDRDNPESLAHTDLVKGENRIRAVPREAEANKEILLDAIVVSTVAFTPTDDAFNNAKERSLAVQPRGKLATVWARLKQQPAKAGY